MTNEYPSTWADDSARPTAAQLFRRYRRPLLLYLLWDGVSESEAEDILQSFFASFLDGGAFRPQATDANRVKSYLLGALKHFVSDARKRASALKRGGGARFVDVDLHALAASVTGDPERAFERRWARAQLTAALSRLRSSYARQGKVQQFDYLRELLDADRGVDYRRAAVAMGISDAALRVALHRFRRRCADALRETLAERLSDPARADAELRGVLDGLACR